MLFAELASDFGGELVVGGGPFREPPTVMQSTVSPNLSNTPPQMLCFAELFADLYSLSFFVSAAPADTRYRSYSIALGRPRIFELEGI